MITQFYISLLLYAFTIEPINQLEISLILRLTSIKKYARIFFSQLTIILISRWRWRSFLVHAILFRLHRIVVGEVIVWGQFAQALLRWSTASRTVKEWATSKVTKNNIRFKFFCCVWMWNIFFQRSLEFMLRWTSNEKWTQKKRVEKLMNKKSCLPFVRLHR